MTSVAGELELVEQVRPKGADSRECADIREDRRLQVVADQKTLVDRAYAVIGSIRRQRVIQVACRKRHCFLWRKAGIVVRCI